MIQVFYFHIDWTLIFRTHFQGEIQALSGERVLKAKSINFLEKQGEIIKFQVETWRHVSKFLNRGYSVGSVSAS